MGGRPPPRSRDGLGARERTVLDALPARGVLGLDALVRAAGLSHTDVLAGIGILTAEGWAVDDGGGWRLARPTGPATA